MVSCYKSCLGHVILHSTRTVTKTPNKPYHKVIIYRTGQHELSIHIYHVLPLCCLCFFAATVSGVCPWPPTHLQCTIAHVLMVHQVHVVSLGPCFLVLRLCLSPLSGTGCPVIWSINVQRTRTETQRWTSILLLASQNPVGRDLKIFKSSNIP